MRDPFKIEGSALISFSGGRTSAYMLWRIIQAWGGTLPDDVKVTFANTGKEMPETLDFVRDCGERWGVEIVWLEYRAAPEATADRWERVSYETASRNGEPFEALIDRKPHLPNPVARYCTQILKIHVLRNYAWSLGWREWTTVVGLRADEPSRVAKLGRSTEDASDRIAPLADAGITRLDVAKFWNRQNFDLQLANIAGNTPLGNCDLCFLKSASTITAILERMPERADWWISQERKKTGTERGRVFRADRPDYAALLDSVKRQTRMDFGNADARQDCFCTGDS